MSRRRDRDYLADIAEAMARVTEYLAGLSYDQFLGDHKTQDAVVRNLEVVGEATKCLSRGLTNRHQEVPWKALAGVRDKMIHHYFGISYETVWKIAYDEFPGLLSQIESVLAEQTE